MLELSASHSIQLLAAITSGIALFCISLTKLQKYLTYSVIVLIPFQIIQSRYGSLNMVLTYMMGVSMLLSRSGAKGQKLQAFPLLFAFILIYLAFLLAWTVSPRIFFMKNALWMIMFGSNVVLYYVVYHSIKDEKDIHNIIILLAISNLLVIGYCCLQVFIGFGDYQVLGIKEFSIQQNRLDRRLVGPFNAVGITAEYVVLQSLILAYCLFTIGKKKLLLGGIIFCNVAIVFGTGNRGGFICLILAFFIFGFVFRHLLGAKNLMLGFVVGAIILVAAGFYMAKYTDFNVLLERMVGTRLDGITPDTRAGWPYVLDRIAEKPILGHGPRIVVKEEYLAGQRPPLGHIDFYPHSAYLFILYTTGIAGLLAWMVLGGGYVGLLVTQMKRLQTASNTFLSNFPKLGLLVLAIMLIDQFKVEFLRWQLLDYQHYIFALFGLFSGLKNVDP